MKIQSLGPQDSIGAVLAQTYNLPGKIISKGTFVTNEIVAYFKTCLLYTSDAADD